GTATAAIYQAADLERATPLAIMQDFVASVTADPVRLWGRNDLQPVAMRLCPDVVTALERLTRLGLQPRMTGSGSAVFAVLPGQAEVAAVQTADWPSGWQIRVCCGLPEHPLVGWQKDAIM
ncbi:MAG: 4-(cytidine 5'-diphospho)-2-C-methyl-D-erythritol kinase, partial [Hydrogenophaga sp.]